MQNEPDIETRRPPGWASLAAAVAERAIEDLSCPHRAIRGDAREWIESPDFAIYLEEGGVNIPAAEVRRALRRSGRMPDAGGWAHGRTETANPGDGRPGVRCPRGLAVGRGKAC